MVEEYVASDGDARRQRDMERGEDGVLECKRKKGFEGVLVWCEMEEW